MEFPLIFTLLLSLFSFGESQDAYEVQMKQLNDKLTALDNQVSANNAKRQELVPKMWDEFGRAWQMDSDMKGIIQQYEDLNTLADRHEKLNLMWTSNFNKMDSNFRQIKKSVNFKVCTAKYPKMLAATTPKPYR